MNTPDASILHLAPHLGGGVGSVLLNYLKLAKEKSNYNHKILCLDYLNDYAKNFLIKEDIFYRDNVFTNKQYVLDSIRRADITLIHWWNHPQLFDILVNEEFNSSRVIFWSHVSGFNPPYVFSKKLIDFADKFVFTTPISNEVDEIQGLSDFSKKKLHSIWSTRGVDHTKDIVRQNHDSFQVGYIGTLDYSKLNENFLEMSKKIKIPNVKFVVCGGGNSEAEIEAQAKNMNLQSVFEFTGWVNDISKYLSRFDVFGYPLSRHHYGTCDQVLAEAMACGVPPVVLDNPMERYIVKDQITGIVAKNELEYIKGVEGLYKNPNLLRTLSQNAKEEAIRRFSADKLIGDWDDTFQEVIQLEKSNRRWKKEKGRLAPSEVFAESLGDYGEAFKKYINSKSDSEKLQNADYISALAKESSIWRSKTKGSVHHYASFFKEDLVLIEWCKLMS